MSNKLDIHFSDENDIKGNGKLDRLPDHCPQCHHKIDPIKVGGYLNQRGHKSEKALEVVFRCTHMKCNEVFLGYYSKADNSNTFYLKYTQPKQFKERIFNDTIQGISSDFSMIYNQALSAENAGLNQICGGGYRKSLEFLIKDYLLQQTENEEGQDKVKDEQLGICIKNRIKDTNIKEVAKRAAWLGNDETHYLRKWDQKDLQDLKKLIDLTVHWVEAEALTKQLLEDMPDKKKT